ncbi:MAG: cytochrome c peroxidase [Candidatus Acidiferrales bacterium]
MAMARLKRFGVWHLLGCAAGAWLAVVVFSPAPRVAAHIVPAEKLHPVAASYRRMAFLLNLNPVPWREVRKDSNAIAKYLSRLSAANAKGYQQAADAALQSVASGESKPPWPAERRHAARAMFELATRAVSRALVMQLDAAKKSLGDYTAASRALNEARQMWAAFEHEIKHSDPPMFQEAGQCWLNMNAALGNPGVLGAGKIAADAALFGKEAGEVRSYLAANFGDAFRAPERGWLQPLPLHSATFNPDAAIPPRLPPGAEINKQLPRPRQILNMTARGVNESETTLIALGDMAFDSPYIFGEPARSLGISCNTCHNKSITNPQLFVPGLSTVPGTVDVSSSLFAPHANNGHFDPLDIPDLRGIRFTAPYGRNGRTASLREFVRNVIVHEFGGSEPDPLLLDAMIAYMNEFDFLPNPKLNADGTLSAHATAAEKRGEKLFRTPFAGMDRMSCATCHIPSANFTDGKRHNIGAVKGSGAYSRDGALDTPTLLSARWTPPYFHDGSQPSLRAVVEWFNKQFKLGLAKPQVDDLTAYVEAVGDGEEAYEDTVHTLEAEMEEFSFFLSTYEYLKKSGKQDLIGMTLETIALEIRAHKWDVQDQQQLPILEGLAALMDEAYRANQRGDSAAVDAKVAEYRRTYEANKENLK